MSQIIDDADQYGAYGYNKEAIAGLQQGLGAKDDASYIAQEIVYPGRAVVCYPGESGICGHPHKDTALITYSTDFIASNSTIVTVNGVATAAVVYATGHTETMAALVAAIGGLSTVYSATLNGTKAVDIVTKYSLIVATSVTTLGSTQPTNTVAVSDATKVFLGVAMRVQRVPQAPTTTAMYNSGDAVTVREDGKITVELDATTPADNTQSAFMTTPEATVGKFTAYGTSGAIQLAGFYSNGFTSSTTLKNVQVEAKKTIT